MNFKQLVLQEGMHVFQSRGIQELTMEDILAHLTISRSTFAEIARSKDEFLGLCIDEMLEQRKAEFSQIMEDATNAAEAILNILKVHLESVSGNHPLFFSDLKAHYPNCWEKVKDFSGKYLLTYLNELFSLGIDQGLFQAGLDARLISHILMAHSHAIVDSGLLQNHEYNLKTIFKMTFEQYLRGMATEKGRHAMELHEIKQVAWSDLKTNTCLLFLPGNDTVSGLIFYITNTRFLRLFFQYPETEFAENKKSPYFVPAKAGFYRFLTTRYSEF